MDIQEESIDDMPKSARIVFAEDVEVLWQEYTGLVSNGSEDADYIVDQIKTFIGEVGSLYIGKLGYGSIPITPEGPFAESSDKDPITIAWALDTLYGSGYEVYGDIPSMKDLGLDYASNFDEDGNEIVR
jgi:hypothetical protein